MRMKMNKVTKRERKYGKKDEDGIKVSKASEDRITKVIVDHAFIMKFKNMKEAKAFINKDNKESERTGNVPTSFIFI